jgi:ABC-2 type transport system ATP-binding protein
MQLLFPTSGRMEILGRPAGDLELRRRIGFLPEEPYFYDYLTAEELLTYFASLFGLSGPERGARVARLLDEAGIGGERRLALRKLSKGMIQRVGIAQALVNDPEVVFLDEPMSGLDPLGRREMRALVLRLRDRGCTVFFSSHILSDAEALCGRVGILARGRLLAEGRIAQLLEGNVRGWELIVAGVGAAVLRPLAPQASSVTSLDEARHTLVLPSSAAPEPLIAELIVAGARIVSLTPLHQTLEEFFVERVGQNGTRGEPL